MTNTDRILAAMEALKEDREALDRLPPLVSADVLVVFDARNGDTVQVTPRYRRPVAERQLTRR